MPVSGFLKPMFLLARKACLLNKRWKIVFSRFVLTIYYMEIQGVSTGYKRLRGVTGGYKGLQMVTRGYRVLQGVTRATRAYRRLQGVTGDYKGLEKLFAN